MRMTKHASRLVPAIVVILVALTTARLACQQPSSVASVFSATKPSIAAIITSQGWGTGFCIGSDSSNSYYVTNQHVVGSEKIVKVIRQFPTVHRYTGTVISAGTEGDPDLAIVRIGAPNVPSLRLQEQLPNEGDPIVVIGYPFTQLELAIISKGGITPSIHAGTLSAIANRGGLLEYDAQTLPGNSGGPLLDARTGLVLGVVESKIKASTDTNLAIGVARILIPFLNSKGIAFRSASPVLVGSAPRGGPNTPTLRALPGANAALIIYDSSGGSGDISGPLSTAANDLAQKLSAAFSIRVTTVDKHTDSIAEVTDLARSADSLFAIPYSASFHSVSSKTNAYGTYTKWTFELQAGFIDTYGMVWSSAKRSKTVTSARTGYDAIASSLADLNDQVVAALKDAIISSAPDESAVHNFFRYALPMPDGAKRVFITLKPGADGASVSFVATFSPAVEAGLQVGDIVKSINGVSLVAKDQNGITSALRDATLNGTVDLVILNGDGTTQHIKFDAQDLRWYLAHRSQTI